MTVVVWRCQKDIFQSQIVMNNPIPVFKPMRARTGSVSSMSTVTQSICKAIKHMPYKGLRENKSISVVSRALWVELSYWVLILFISVPTRKFP